MNRKKEKYSSKDKFCWDGDAIKACDPIPNMTEGKEYYIESESQKACGVYLYKVKNDINELIEINSSCFDLIPLLCCQNYEQDEFLNIQPNIRQERSEESARKHYFENILTDRDLTVLAGVQKTSDQTYGEMKKSLEQATKLISSAMKIIEDLTFELAVVQRIANGSSSMPFGFTKK